MDEPGILEEEAEFVDEEDKENDAELSRKRQKGERIIFSEMETFCLLEIIGNFNC